MRNASKLILVGGAAALGLTAVSLRGLSLKLPASEQEAPARPASAAAAASPSTEGPSFHCTGARTAIERAICADPELSRLDADLAERFRTVLASATGGERSALLTAQRGWLGERDLACAKHPTEDALPCLREAYSARAVWLEATRGGEGPFCEDLEQAWRAADRLKQPRFSLHSADLASDRFRIFDREEDQQSAEDHPEWANRLPQSKLLDTVGINTRIIRATGASPLLTAVVETGGTMQCSSFEFYEPVQGSFRRIEAPEPETDEYCMQSTEIARVGSTPALVQEVTGEDADYAKIVQRQASGWRTTCELTAHYRTDFQVDAEFCGGADCAPFRSRVLAWVRELDVYEDAHAGSSADAPPPSGLQRTRRHDPRGYCCSPFEGEPGWEDGGGSVPTFGREYAGEAATQFLSDRPLYGFDTARERYLVRLSPAMFGWRTTDDYVVGVYRLRGNRLEPVAGYVVLQRRAGLDRIERGS